MAIDTIQCYCLDQTVFVVVEVWIFWCPLVIFTCRSIYDYLVSQEPYNLIIYRIAVRGEERDGERKGDRERQGRHRNKDTTCWQLYVERLNDFINVAIILSVPAI